MKKMKPFDILVLAFSGATKRRKARMLKHALAGTPIACGEVHWDAFYSDGKA